MHEVEKVLFDIVNHIEKYGNHIVLEDQPKRLLLGWRCTKTNVLWNLSLSQVKEYSNKDIAIGNPKIYLHNIIMNNIGYTSKRISFLLELQKVNKLKAFW